LPLTAIHAATGEIVEAFNLTPERWQQMKAEPAGSYLVRRSGLPAVLKKNVRGTHWFAARPDENDAAWKPTSPEHEFAQVQMVKALRAAGFTARIEEPGYTPSGERWEADVFVKHADRKIAIEVQMSPQGFEEYERRSEKYIQSGVKVVWLVNSRHFENFTLGCCKRNGVTYPSGPIVNGEQFHRDFPAFPLKFYCPKGEPTTDATKVAVFLPPNGWPAQELSLDEFAVGLVNGALTHSRRRFWTWTK
jgi:hypothetical protein